MSQLVVRGEDTESALLSALKLLEIQKTLGAEPVLAALRHFPAQAARHTEFPPDLHPKLKEVLQARGVARPYTHQALAYEAAREGRSTVVVTPTASGKTLCYNLPVLDRILKDPDALKKYAAVFFEPTYRPSDAFRKYVLDDLATWKEIAGSEKIVMEE